MQTELEQAVQYSLLSCREINCGVVDSNILCILALAHVQMPNGARLGTRQHKEVDTKLLWFVFVAHVTRAFSQATTNSSFIETKVRWSVECIPTGGIEPVDGMPQLATFIPSIPIPKFARND